MDLEEVERKRNKIASNRFSNLLIELCSLEYKRQMKATKTVSKLLDLFDFTLAFRLLFLLLFSPLLYIKWTEQTKQSFGKFSLHQQMEPNL